MFHRFNAQFTLAFFRIIPFFSIMNHYVILLYWFGKIQDNNQYYRICDKDLAVKLEVFLAYWLPHIVVVYLASLAIHLSIKWHRKLYYVVYSLVAPIFSVFVFVSWCLIREEPFGCYIKDINNVYIYGPMIFVLIHLIVVIICYLFVLKRENFVENSYFRL